MRLTSILGWIHRMEDRAKTTGSFECTLILLWYVTAQSGPLAAHVILESACAAAGSHSCSGNSCAACRARYARDPSQRRCVSIQAICVVRPRTREGDGMNAILELSEFDACGRSGPRPLRLDADPVPGRTIERSGAAALAKPCAAPPFRPGGVARRPLLLRHWRRVRLAVQSGQRRG